MATADSMVPSGPSSAGQQAVVAYLQSKGLPVNAGNIRRAIEANAREPGDPTANGPNLGPVVLNLRNAGIEDASPMPQRGGGEGRTSAPPTRTATDPPSITSNVRPDVIAPEGGAAAIDPASGSSLMQTLAPLLAGAGAASFPLGAYILDKIRGGAVSGAGGAAPIVTGPRLSTGGPRFAPEYGAGRTAPSGPGFAPEYGPMRPATPPTQPAPGPRAPPVEPVVPPVAPTTPTGAGFSPEYGSPAMQPLPQTPAGDAVTKAVGKDAPAPRAKAKPRAKARLRLP